MLPARTLLSAKPLDTTSLTVGVAAVAARPLPFLMSHCVYPRYQSWLSNWETITFSDKPTGNQPVP